MEKKDFMDFVIEATKNDPSLGTDFLKFIESVESEKALAEWFGDKGYSPDEDEIIKIFNTRKEITKMDLSRSDVKAY